MDLFENNLEQIDRLGNRQLDTGAEPNEKPAEIHSGDQVQNASHMGESPQDTSQREREEKMDLMMRNIKEFIRNIDLQSL